MFYSNLSKLIHPQIKDLIAAEGSMRLVSVIIPTYNCARYVKKAIRSVLDQTYGNIEIIVIDDGSTDDTGDVIRAFKKDIKYIFQKNTGLPGARNRGMQEASGEYIAFLDADDLWRKNKLKIQTEVLESFPSVSIVFSDFSAFNEDGYKEESYFRKGFPIFHENKFTLKDIFQKKSTIYSDGYPVGIQVFHGHIARYLFCGNFILPSSVLLRKSALDHLGGFDEKYRVAEETEFFLRYCTFYDAAFVDFPLVDYLTKRTGKLTGRSNTERLIKNAIDIQEDYIVNHQGIYDSNKLFFNKAIAKTYVRLAYYYMTVAMNKLTRQEAVRSISWMPLQVKAYIYLVISFCPSFFFVAAGRFKRIMKGLPIE